MDGKEEAKNLRFAFWLMATILAFLGWATIDRYYVLQSLREHELAYVAHHFVARPIEVPFSKHGDDSGDGLFLHGPKGTIPLYLSPGEEGRVVRNLPVGNHLALSVLAIKNAGRGSSVHFVTTIAELGTIEGEADLVSSDTEFEASNVCEVIRGTPENEQAFAYPLRPDPAKIAVAWRIQGANGLLGLGRGEFEIDTYYEPVTSVSLADLSAKPGRACSLYEVAVSQGAGKHPTLVGLGRKAERATQPVSPLLSHSQPGESLDRTYSRLAHDATVPWMKMPGSDIRMPARFMIWGLFAASLVIGLWASRLARRIVARSPGLLSEVFYEAANTEGASLSRVDGKMLARVEWIARWLFLRICASTPLLLLFLILQWQLGDLQYSFSGVDLGTWIAIGALVLLLVPSTFATVHLWGIVSRSELMSMTLELSDESKDVADGDMAVADAATNSMSEALPKAHVERST